jgi:hypothetical protein
MAGQRLSGRRPDTDVEQNRLRVAQIACELHNLTCLIYLFDVVFFKDLSWQTLGHDVSKLHSSSRATFSQTK